MQFQLQVKPIQLAVVASHGITDFDIPYFWLEYASCLLTPVPDVVITVLFLCASVLHFRRFSIEQIKCDLPCVTRNHWISVWFTGCF